MYRFRKENWARKVDSAYPKYMSRTNRDYGFFHEVPHHAADTQFVETHPSPPPLSLLPRGKLTAADKPTLGRRTIPRRKIREGLYYDYDNNHDMWSVMSFHPNPPLDMNRSRSPDRLRTAKSRTRLGRSLSPVRQPTAASRRGLRSGIRLPALRSTSYSQWATKDNNYRMTDEEEESLPGFKRDREQNNQDDFRSRGRERTTLNRGERNQSPSYRTGQRRQTRKYEERNYDDMFVSGLNHGYVSNVATTGHDEHLFKRNQSPEMDDVRSRFQSSRRRTDVSNTQANLHNHGYALRGMGRYHDDGNHGNRETGESNWDDAPVPDIRAYTVDGNGRPTWSYPPGHFYYPKPPKSAMRRHKESLNERFFRFNFHDRWKPSSTFSRKH